MNNAGADSSSSRSQSRRWRTFLQIISVVVAVEIGLHSFIVREPVVTIVLATLWLAGFFSIRRGGRGGPILIGVLSLIELLGTVFFSDEAAPWRNCSGLGDHRAHGSCIRGSRRRRNDAKGANRSHAVTLEGRRNVRVLISRC